MPSELHRLRTMLTTLLATQRPTIFVSQVTLLAQHCLVLALLKEQQIDPLGTYGYIELAERAIHALSVHLQASLASESWPELTFWPAGPGKRVVEQLLREGKLDRTHFPRLQAELRTSDHFRTPNPTLVATFGLYLNGATREEIAEALGCSMLTIRNYISLIYHHFGVATDQGLGGHARRQQLLAITCNKGFISEK